MSSSLPLAAQIPSPDREGRIVLTVTELTRKVKSVLDREIGSVWVTGEVSNWSVSASGHQYFTLKDDSIAISVVLFAGVAHRIRFKIEDGIAILVHGKVSIYEKTGKYQIVAERVEPRRMGLQAVLAAGRNTVQGPWAGVSEKSRFHYWARQEPRPPDPRFGGRASRPPHLPCRWGAGEPLGEIHRLFSLTPSMSWVCSKARHENA